MMVRIKNPDILREKVLKIEAKIRDIIENTPWWDEKRRLRDKVEDLCLDRACYLNRMFRGTPDEVARFEAINNMLLRKVEDMQKRAALLWQTMLEMKQMSGFDDIYEIRAELHVEGDRSDDEAVLKLPDDEYYGSDFALANETIVATMPKNWCHASCGHLAEPWKVPLIGLNPDNASTDSMEDGTSWNEPPLNHPAFSHICICHPLHDLANHLNFSILDILRLNSFKARVSLEINNSVTQSGTRSFEPGYRSWNTDKDTDFGYIDWLKDNPCNTTDT